MCTQWAEHQRRAVGPLVPNALRGAVREHRADLGIAFDGDGDRVMMVDAEGEIVDGDDLLFIIAQESPCPRSPQRNRWSAP